MSAFGPKSDDFSGSSAEAVYDTVAEATVLGSGSGAADAPRRDGE